MTHVWIVMSNDWTPLYVRADEETAEAIATTSGANVVRWIVTPRSAS